MTEVKTTLHFLCCGCWIRVSAEYDRKKFLDDLVQHLEKKLDAEFMFKVDEDKTP